MCIYWIDVSVVEQQYIIKTYKYYFVCQSLPTLGWHSFCYEPTEEIANCGMYRWTAFIFPPGDPVNVNIVLCFFFKQYIMKSTKLLQIKQYRFWLEIKPCLFVIQHSCHDLQIGKKIQLLHSWCYIIIKVFSKDK